MSDYEKTQRKVVDGVVQYATGGSRVRGVNVGTTGISKVGKVKPEEVFGKVPVVDSTETQEALYDHNELREQGLEFKGRVVKGDKYFDNGQWQPLSNLTDITKPAPGDTILITDSRHNCYGLKAIIKKVRNYASGKCSAVIISDSKWTSQKMVFEGDQYVVSKNAGQVDKDDYLMTNITRSKKIVSEDSK